MNNKDIFPIIDIFYVKYTITILFDELELLYIIIFLCYTSFESSFQCLQFLNNKLFSIFNI